MSLYRATRFRVGRSACEVPPEPLYISGQEAPCGLYMLKTARLWASIKIKTATRCRPSSAAAVSEQLNGNNGSWTNTDDLASRFVAPGRRVRVPRRSAQNRASRRGGTFFGPDPSGVARARIISSRLDEEAERKSEISSSAPDEETERDAETSSNPSAAIAAEPWAEHWFGGPPPFADNEDAVEWIKRNYKRSAHPNCRCLFSFEEVVTPQTHFSVDPLGSPFCGLTAIDIATKTPTSFSDYMKMRTGPDPTTAGTPNALSQFALQREVNLRIYAQVDNAWVERASYLHSGGWKTVFLLYQEPRAGPVGHYRLICQSRASLVNYSMPKLREPSFWWYHIPIVLALTVASAYIPSDGGIGIGVMLVLSLLSPLNWVPILTFGPIQYDVSDSDTRPPNNRRDPIETQDAYCNTSEVWWVRYAKLRLFPWPFARKYTISVIRFMQLYEEAQALLLCGLSVDKCLAGVTHMRAVNTTPWIASVYWNTGHAIRLIAKHSIDAGVPVSDEPGAIVAYNAHACEVVVTSSTPTPPPGLEGERARSWRPAIPPSVQVIQRRQTEGMIGGLVNHFVSVDRLLTFKINRPVAVNLVRVRTTAGIMGPGMFPLTDPCTTLAAFALRSMTAKDKEPERLADFVRFSKNFLRRYVRSAIHARHEPDCVEKYRVVQRGKRSRDSVQRTIDQYHAYKAGFGNKKTAQHSCFVKFENSAKFREDGTIGVKPRLIMTMSDVMAIECSPILDLIDDWNHGDFSKFQVKDISPVEMMRRVMEATLMPHNVSDYSSFEASVDHAVRKIELFAMDEMCKRANYHRTRLALRKHARGGRVLRYNGGKVRIYSRCSGDYWTSFGNGIVNVCIMAYCAYLKGMDPHSIHMLAEGDDGIVPRRVPDPEIIKALGFGFSTSLQGSQPGDCDFLRSRWIGGKRYLNIGRCFSAFWIKRAANLKPGKQKFLQRCIANSLHHLSPGHPVIAAIVDRLLRESEGATRFKGYKKYLETWRAKDYREIKDYSYEVDESMRSEVARGAGEFPPLPVSAQLVLEHRIRHDPVIYVGSLLDQFEDFLTYKHSGHKLHTDMPRSATEIQLLADVVGSRVLYATDAS